MLSSSCGTAVITDLSLPFLRMVYVSKGFISPHFTSWWKQETLLSRCEADGKMRGPVTAQGRCFWGCRESSRLSQFPQLMALFCIPDSRHPCLDFSWGAATCKIFPSHFPPLSSISSKDLKFFCFLVLFLFVCHGVSEFSVGSTAWHSCLLVHATPLSLHV